MKTVCKRARFWATAFTAPLLCISFGSISQNLPDEIDRVLKEHQLIQMVDADVATAKEQVKVEKSGYYPKLTLRGAIGRQHLEREEGANGNYDPSEMSAGISQLITDFGYTPARVEAAQTVVTKEEAERELQRQNLTLAAIEAQLQLIQAWQALSFAQASENRIKEQTSLENARMDAGRGYATDVLQAKAQLAGAEARRVASERMLSVALNRYETVFGTAPKSLSDMQGIHIPIALMPSSPNQIIESIASQNPDVVAAIQRTNVVLAESNVSSKNEWMPRVTLDLRRSRHHDYDGSYGRRDDSKAMINLEWQFDFGLRAVHVDRAAAQAIVSAKQKTDYVRVQAREEALNAWSEWRTSQARSEYLISQATIASRFLELAGQEREMGRRSLLDILNGEVSLINAQSDASIARIDEVIAAYRLLRAVGRLSPSILREPGIVVPAESLLSTALPNG
ncbi:TolC family protein [Neopusillimonas maritima]|uniref:Transporter n=1 Tax=Neopusillimonas maritima TaxID=2026239 RepID=A0ABX9MY76_9BURK|nr:TolC family protein [Neopusillimonas maritima]RII83498.1 hypothetical protein CJO09_07865 [Neopusillimonas maritima]